MTTITPLEHSIQARLARVAKELRVDPNLILSRYAAERLLYRLARSRHAERFVLKGAMLLVVWLGDVARPTRDVDLLGIGDMSDEAIAATFAEIAALEVEPDGVTFDPASIGVARIREEDAYGGRRVTLRGLLGRARLHVQIDIGIGDVVYPEPEAIDYPSLLDLPRPRLNAYRPETSIAEKLHAMVALGAKNSRMRDFFDIRTLAEKERFDGVRLATAIRRTFDRRATAVPARPLALTPAFAQIEGKEAQWSGFLRRYRLPAEDFSRVIKQVSSFLGPVVVALAADEPFTRIWPPGGSWQ
ncbi:MAG: nucleotidyl transferase AbiEii/AbiGii toxin family protein [Acidobacteria bacterium]|nr:nucleotidyl transferase AbiEii/AbiGii toxin family protein [Acidobacteriota bacterium]